MASVAETSEWQQPMRGIAARTVMMAPRDEKLTATMGKIVCCSYLAWFLTPPPNGGDDDILADDRVIASEAPFEVQKEKLFTIGEGDTVAAMELALRHSQAGDVLFLRAASKFAYSATGRPGAAAASSAEAENEPNASDAPSRPATAGSSTPRTFDYAEAQAKFDTYTADPAAPVAAVPPYTDLEYVIRVEGVYDDPVAALRRASPEYDQRCETKDCSSAGEHVVAEMQIRKMAGNGWFAMKDYARAGKAYAKAIQIAEVFQSQAAGADAAAEEAGDVPTQDDGRDDVAAAMLTALNNLAACYLSRGDHAKAKEVCVRVLEMDMTNTKALLRAARASLALHEYDEAELCVKRALELTTEAAKTDPDADPHKIATFYSMELAKVEKARREYKVREKEMAKAMASRLFKKPAAAALATPGSSSSSPSSSSNNVDTASLSSADVATAGAGTEKEKEAEKGASSYFVPILLACNAAVLLVSVVIAYMLNK